MRLIANREISDFSVRVLGYDREKPDLGQRRPGETLEEVEERMATRKSRTASTHKWIGALLLGLATMVLGAAAGGVWPALTTWLRALL